MLACFGMLEYVDEVSERHSQCLSSVACSVGRTAFVAFVTSNIIVHSWMKGAPPPDNMTSRQSVEFSIVNTSMSTLNACWRHVKSRSDKDRDAMMAVYMKLIKMRSTATATRARAGYDAFASFEDEVKNDDVSPVVTGTATVRVVSPGDKDYGKFGAASGELVLYRVPRIFEHNHRRYLPGDEGYDEAYAQYTKAAREKREKSVRRETEESLRREYMYRRPKKPKRGTKRKEPTVVAPAAPAVEIRLAPTGPAPKRPCRKETWRSPAIRRMRHDAQRLWARRAMQKEHADSVNAAAAAAFAPGEDEGESDAVAFGDDQAEADFAPARHDYEADGFDMEGNDEEEF
jgi:hypothetical protein